MMVLLGLGMALAGPPMDPTVLEAAIQAELNRAMTQLKLPDQPGLYEAEVTVFDNNVARTESHFGQTTALQHLPNLSARVDLRVGSLQVNSTNYSGLYGVPDGVERRTLPTDGVQAALQRELWLAMDIAYKGATQQLAAKLSGRDGQARSYTADSTHVPALTLPRIPYPSVDIEGVRATAAALSAPFADFAQIETGRAVGMDRQSRRLLMNSTGSRAWSPEGHTVYRVEAKLRTQDGGVIRTTRSWVARTPEQLPSRDVMVAQSRAMAQWAVDLAQAPVEEDYLGPVLFEPAAATEVFRQLLHPQLAGTLPREDSPDSEGDDGISPPLARIGRRLLPEGWTVVDDPTASLEAAGSFSHDMEGTPAQRIELVRGGVLRDLLMSRIPRKTLNKSTGHARSLGSSRRVAMPGVVTVRAPKIISDKALRKRALALAKDAGLPYVLVVRRLTTLAMDESDQISFAGDAPTPGLSTPVELYRLYPDGTQTPVRGASFSGVDRRVLRDIVAAGQGAGMVDLLDRPGASFRTSIGELSGIPVTWDTPQILISELELRGRSGGEQRVIPPPTDP
jgi:hypothetical protein